MNQSDVRPTAVFNGSWAHQFRSIAARVVLAAALAAPLVTEPAHAATDLAEPASEQEIALRLQQARDFMDSKVAALGILAGPQFVDTVKKNARLTRSFLDRPDQPIPLTGLLGEIVQRYSLPLSQAKRHHPGLYQETVKFFDDAISIIETAPLSK